MPILSSNDNDIIVDTVNSFHAVVLFFPTSQVWSPRNHPVNRGNRIIADLKEVLLDGHEVRVLFECRNLVACFCVAPKIWEVIESFLIQLTLEVEHNVKAN